MAPSASPVVIEDRGRPRANNVQDNSLLDSFSTASGEARPSGTMYKDLGDYSFIKADSGGEYMFVMPFAGVVMKLVRHRGSEERECSSPCRFPAKHPQQVKP